MLGVRCLAPLPADPDRLVPLFATARHGAPSPLRPGRIFSSFATREIQARVM